MPDNTTIRNFGHDKILSKQDMNEITELFEGKCIINKKSNDELTIKWNDGGILFLRVKPEERLYK